MTNDEIPNDQQNDEFVIAFGVLRHSSFSPPVPQFTYNYSRIVATESETVAHDGSNGALAWLIRCVIEVAFGVSRIVVNGRRADLIAEGQD